MKDLKSLLEQAQLVQAGLHRAQAAMQRQEVRGESGGGLVRVSMSGAHDVRSVHIEASLLREDVAVIEDLLAAAFNDAVRRVEALQREQLEQAAGELKLPPGFNLPF